MTNDIYYAVAHRSQEEIDSFKDRYAHFDTKTIPLIFKTILNNTLTSWSPSSTWGTSHVIYEVRIKELNKPLILRANLGICAPEKVMKVEQLITEKVTKLGVQTNQVLYADATRTLVSFDFQIEEKLEGKDPEKCFTGTKKEYDSYSFEIGRCIARMSELQFDKFGRFDGDRAEKGELIGTKDSFPEYIFTMLEEDISKLVAFGMLSEPSGKQVKKIFEEYVSVMNIPKGSLVHHDLADHNLLIDKNNRFAGLFDWEAAVIGDPVLDLASCPTWTTPFPKEEKLIEGYSSTKALPDHFQEKMDIYRLRTMLWKGVFYVRANLVDDKRLQVFKNALKPFKLA